MFVFISAFSAATLWSMWWDVQLGFGEQHYWVMSHFCPLLDAFSFFVCVHVCVGTAGGGGGGAFIKTHARSHARTHNNKKKKKKEK